MATTPAHNESNESNETQYECGTSLVEQEQQEQLLQPLSRRNEEKKQLISNEVSSRTVDQLRTLLADDVVTDKTGFLQTFQSPFLLNKAPVEVPLVYCDHTASNRPLQSVEDTVNRTCLPLLANTHTNTSITGSQRYEAQLDCCFPLNNNSRYLQYSVCRRSETNHSGRDKRQDHGQG